VGSLRMALGRWPGSFTVAVGLLILRDSWLYTATEASRITTQVLARVFIMGISSFGATGARVLAGSVLSGCIF
jgi:hypothetical protein